MELIKTENSKPNLIELYNGDFTEEDNERLIKLIDGNFALDNDKEIVCIHSGEYVHSEDAVYVENLAEWYEIDDVTFSDILDEYILLDDAVYIYSSRYDNCPSVVDEDRISEYGVWSGIHDLYIDADEAVFCVDVEEYEFIEETYYDEYSGEHYSEEPSLSIERIRGYQSGLPMRFNIASENSRFFIGFEVEKNGFNTKNGTADCQGEYVGDFPLFAGYETDCSCGVEAITNVYTLDDGKGHEKFKRDLFDSSDIVNSPADMSCGGHINVSAKDVNGDTIPSDELYNAVKPYTSLLYAMFKRRLNNNYCSSNKKMDIDKRDAKYQPIRAKGGGIVEFRLFSAIKNAKQLERRYRLMYELMNAALVTKPTFGQFINVCQPILKEMYSNHSKVDRVMKEAFLFNAWINDLHQPKEIAEFTE